MYLKYFFWGLPFLLLTACQTTPETYEKWVASELAKKERNDSLFLDIHFQMSSKDFYAHCWNLNKQGLLMDGNGNATARYRLETELEHPADFEFYPRFEENKIVAMPAFVEYDAWAPWNKELSAENRIEEVRALLEDWYGITFRPVKPLMPFSKAYVNIEGNRKILLFYEFENRVDILYTDLTAVEDQPNELLE
jgi:hypothetical protein